MHIDVSRGSLQGRLLSCGSSPKIALHKFVQQPMASLAGPSYPERFYLAANYASIPGTYEGAEDRMPPPNLRDDSKLVLYALYQQVGVQLDEAVECGGL